MHDPITIVLVHGALTDASVWTEVTKRLQGRGARVLAPAMPLRGLAADAAYLAAFAASIEGQIFLVGHSYAGAVITQVAAPNVRALVYVAAFQPDTGETAGELNARFPGGRLGPETTMTRPYPGGTEIYLRPESFREVYASDVDPGTAAAMAAMQRPIDPRTMSEPLIGAPAWRSLPSWALVATNDVSIPTAALRFMASRAGSTTEEVASSHAVPVAHPNAVVTLVERALRNVRTEQESAS
jgi:pimeloyl-ACP methyl ester carboxylesterase